MALGMGSAMIQDVKAAIAAMWEYRAEMGFRAYRAVATPSMLDMRLRFLPSNRLFFGFDDAGTRATNTADGRDDSHARARAGRAGLRVAADFSNTAPRAYLMMARISRLYDARASS